VCHHDFEQLRERAARVRSAANSYGFRCPECRRIVVAHAIVEAMRATALEVAPAMVRGRPTREIDAEAMRRHAATLPAPAEPTFGDFVNAHVDDEDLVANTAPPFSMVRIPGVAPAPLQVAVIGVDSGGSDIQRRVREALEAAGLVHNGSVLADDAQNDDARQRVEQEMAREFLRDAVTLLEARVPQDLRMWTREGSVPERICYKYMYYRPSMPTRLSTAFEERMRERGVSVRRVSLGYELTLPLENEERFSSS